MYLILSCKLHSIRLYNLLTKYLSFILLLCCRHKWTSLIEYCLDILETRRLDALAAPMSSSNANNLKIGLRRLQVAYNKKHPLYAETKTAGQPKRFTIAGFTTLSAETFKFVKDEEKISIKVSIHPSNIIQIVLHKLTSFLPHVELFCNS